MKFLVCTCPTEEGTKSLPRAADFAAQTEWFRQKLADGTIDVAHHAPGRALFIFNAEDADALNALLNTVPLSQLMQRTVEPLADFWAHTAGVLDYLKKAEAEPV
jgi:muconolactone delta-isomerase